jgi:serine/threonine protein kinase
MEDDVYVSKNDSSFISSSALGSAVNYTKEILTGTSGKKIVCSKKLLGKGSFSKVYAGEMSVPVAIKKIVWDHMTPEKVESTKKYIESEIDIMKSLSHTNIVNLMDVVWKDEQLFLVLEQCEGGDLKKFLKGRPLKEKYAKFYLKQLADGLKYLRSFNITHRDLKPQNLLLTNNNKTLKITDFGFAKIVGSEALAETMCGSPLYMAPEIMENTPYTTKADLWSVGIIMYEILFAKYPIKGVNGIFDLIHKIKHTSVITIPERPTVSTDCKDLLRGLLQKDYRDRISWEDYFTHPWFNGSNTVSSSVAAKKSKTMPQNRNAMPHSQSAMPGAMPGAVERSTSLINFSALSKVCNPNPEMSVDSKVIEQDDVKIYTPKSSTPSIPIPLPKKPASQWEDDDYGGFSPTRQDESLHLNSTSPFVKSYTPLQLNIIDDYTSTDDFSAKYKTHSAPVLPDPPSRNSTDDPAGSGFKRNVRDYVFASYHLIKDSFRSFHN